MNAGMEEKNIKFFDKPQEIYSAITLFCKSGDAVLLEGRVPAGLVNLLKQWIILSQFQFRFRQMLKKTT